MTAADRIRARVAELQGIRERYLAYQRDRVAERDHHGAWDVAVNLSETECEISGLEFALSEVTAVTAVAALSDLPPPRKQRMWVDDGYFYVQGADPIARFVVQDVVRMLEMAAKEALERDPDSHSGLPADWLTVPPPHTRKKARR